MSLVADYSSDSDSDNSKYQGGSNTPELSPQANKVKKSSHSGPHKIFVDIPKKLDDYSSDEELKKDKLPSAYSKVSSLTFSKLKFKGNGSSLFDMLPPPKALNEELSEEHPTSKGSETLCSEHTEDNLLKHTKLKSTATNFIPSAVNNKTKLQSGLAKSKLNHKNSLVNPVSTLTESLFPIGNNIQDSYIQELPLPSAYPRHKDVPNFNLNENNSLENVSSKEPSDSFYYGYDYSTANSDSLIFGNHTSLSQEIPIDNLEPTDRLPEDAERFFGGNKKRNLNQRVNILDIDLGKEMNSEEALQARAIRASGAPSTFSSTNLDSNSLYKRRHNIVFLAQQARARENELEERYAENRRTKRETKSKYGF